MADEISARLEDYLEAIYRIEDEQKVARVRDISQMLGVANSTVTAALQSLAERDLVNYEPYELITLTDEGSRVAERVVARHRIVKDFLQNVLALDPERADETACEMEHAVDAEALQRFVCFLVFIRRSTAEEDSWIKRFREFLQQGAEGQTCRDCVRDYMKTIGAEGIFNASGDVEA
jgi:DtxR family Mn-dependent transcriptional regulator